MVVMLLPPMLLINTTTDKSKSPMFIILSPPPPHDMSGSVFHTHRVIYMANLLLYSTLVLIVILASFRTLLSAVLYVYCLLGRVDFF